MAPEVLKQEEQTEKTDVWCLGVFLYEMVIGVVPYESKDIKCKLELIREYTLLIPKEIQISEDLKSLIFLILKEDVSKRPSLTKILSHPWISKNAKKHNIDISKYLTLSTNENHANSSYKELESNKSLRIEKNSKVFSNEIKDFNEKEENFRKN